MANKTKISDYDPTASNNTDIGGIGIVGSVNPVSNLDNAIREQMAQLAAHFAKGTIASAPAPDLGSLAEHYIEITGTTTITGLGTVKAGTIKVVEFAGALTLTHNATSLILPGGANITTAVGDIAWLVSEGAGNWRMLAYQSAAGNVMKGHLFGGAMTQNVTDSDHDIDFSLCSAASDDASPVWINAAAQTKQLDATWASGTNAGGRSSSVSLTAGTWYHCFVGLVAGAGEFGFDTSVTGANLKADHSFTNVRRIGSVRTEGASNITNFRQVGDRFLWDVPQADVSASNPGSASVLRALSLPPDVQTTGILGWQLQMDRTAALSCYGWITDPDTTPGTPTRDFSNIGVGSSVAGTVTHSNAGQIQVVSNTSSQVRTIVSSSSASTVLSITTEGWIDDRGKAA